MFPRRPANPPQADPFCLLVAAWQEDGEFRLFCLHFCGSWHNEDLVEQTVEVGAKRQFLVQHFAMLGGSHCSPFSTLLFPQIAGGAPGGLTMGGFGGPAGVALIDGDLVPEKVDPTFFEAEFVGDAASVSDDDLDGMILDVLIDELADGEVDNESVIEFELLGDGLVVQVPVPDTDTEAVPELVTETVTELVPEFVTDTVTDEDPVAVIDVVMDVVTETDPVPDPDLDPVPVPVTVGEGVCVIDCPLESARRATTTTRSFRSIFGCC